MSFFLDSRQKYLVYKIRGLRQIMLQLQDFYRLFYLQDIGPNSLHERKYLTSRQNGIVTILKEPVW